MDDGTKRNTRKHHFGIYESENRPILTIYLNRLLTYLLTYLLIPLVMNTERVGFLHVIK